MQTIKQVLLNKRTQSPIEALLYQQLIKVGIMPECQYSVEPFFIDLAFPEIKLAIEADGKDWHSSKEQRERDKYRQSRLEKLGWKFERFRGWFLKRYPSVAASKIALKYFEDKLTEEQKTHCIGIISMFFANRDINFSVNLLNSFLEHKKLTTSLQAKPN